MTINNTITPTPTCHACDCSLNRGSRGDTLLLLQPINLLMSDETHHQDEAYRPHHDYF